MHTKQVLKQPRLTIFSWLDSILQLKCYICGIRMAFDLALKLSLI
uniref:Uncharacterized protein n=1 Tax=Tetranychus urticae TaxID=32264 RepID=A0A158P4M8_TETUR